MLEFDEQLGRLLVECYRLKIAAGHTMVWETRLQIYNSLGWHSPFFPPEICETAEIHLSESLLHFSAVVRADVKSPDHERWSELRAKCRMFMDAAADLEVASDGYVSEHLVDDGGSKLASAP